MICIFGLLSFIRNCAMLRFVFNRRIDRPARMPQCKKKDPCERYKKNSPSPCQPKSSCGRRPKKDCCSKMHNNTKDGDDDDKDKCRGRQDICNRGRLNNDKRRSSRKENDCGDDDDNNINCRSLCGGSLRSLSPKKAKK